MRPKLDDRFWSKVDKHGDPPANRPELGPCHVWLASVCRRGYGKFWYDGKPWKAHRLAYIAEHGKVPAKKPKLDHLCRRRTCVNPAHLEPVTQAVNTLRGESPAARHARKTVCPQGHAYDKRNTIVYRGKRYCRACQRERRKV